MERTCPKTSLTVGDVARRSGIAISTVHFYEAKGLIAGWRTIGNQRRYHRAVLRRIAIIRIAQRAGLQLGAIRDGLGGLPQDRVPDKADWRRLSENWRQMIEDRIDCLTQLRDQITGCIGCGCLSLEECPLRNPDDILGREGTGPRRLIAAPPSDEDEGGPRARGGHRRVRA
ncbi:redox-sensitive transcriptional activator SoxR [Shinella zoogloeoides]|uniref:redox-sensitive transcriptional activator SoxR n=1 Tax=Shinella zoogloeoides TaxID=352475 RepID=UPI000E64E951|nr:redox-sensitive transcriptional activator SoxR [Shinella zoogloeoides]